MTTKQNFDGVRWTTRVDLAALNATETVVLPSNSEATLAIKPGASGSVKVEFSASSVADVHAGNGLFLPAEGLGAGGVVNSAVIEALLSPLTAIRFTQTAGAGARVEVVQ